MGAKWEQRVRAASDPAGQQCVRPPGQRVVYSDFPLAACCVHHGPDVIHPLLERGEFGQAVR